MVIFFVSSCLGGYRRRNSASRILLGAKRRSVAETPAPMKLYDLIFSLSKRSGDPDVEAAAQTPALSFDLSPSLHFVEKRRGRKTAGASGLNEEIAGADPDSSG